MSIKRFSNASAMGTGGKSHKLWDQTTFQSGMFALATVSLTSTASTITFSGIPSTYTHLQLRAILRDTAAQSGSQDQIWFNNDTSNLYNDHQLYGTGSATGAAGATGSRAAIFGIDRIPAANDTASVFGAFIIDVLDYANTNKYKTIRSLTGYDANGSGQAKLASGLYMSTNAINRIDLTPQSGGSFAINSSFALYGIKSA